MPFEKFTETGRSYKPKVTIRKTGSIGFTTAAINKFGLHKNKYVVLYYDPQEGKVGIRPTIEAEDGAHKINKSKNSTWVAAKRFFDYYEISDMIGRYDATWDTNAEMIVFQIKGGDSSDKEKNRSSKSSA